MKKMIIFEAIEELLVVYQEIVNIYERSNEQVCRNWGKHFAEWKKMNFYLTCNVLA